MGELYHGLSQNDKHVTACLQEALRDANALELMSLMRFFLVETRHGLEFRHEPLIQPTVCCRCPFAGLVLLALELACHTGCPMSTAWRACGGLSQPET